MKIKTLDPRLVSRLIAASLQEDLGSRGDVTAKATIRSTSISRARIFAKEGGVLAGVDFATAVIRRLDRKAKLKLICRDGHAFKNGQTILEIEAKTRAILSAERTALNFVQQLSGIASLTRLFVQEARKGALSKHVQILDTRKTTPTLREIEKHAVICGGGTNHRFGLHDMVLIKDNHLAALTGEYSKPIIEAVHRARKLWPGLKVEVECDTLAQVNEAIEAGADIILLDNMSVNDLKRAVKAVADRAKTEASGGVNLKTVSAIAGTGVDFISVGALTHSAPALDFSLEIVESW